MIIIGGALAGTRLAGTPGYKTWGGSLKFVFDFCWSWCRETAMRGLGYGPIVGRATVSSQLTYTRVEDSD